jgi:predicted Zn-dependent peptidase
VSVVDCVAAMLLQRALGMGSHVKYGGGQGKLAQVAAAASSANHSVSALGQMYSDAGLLGAMVICEAASAGKVVGAVAAALRSAKVTDEEVAAAKKNMLADVYTMLEAPLNQIENMGSQVGTGHIGAQIHQYCRC